MFNLAGGGGNVQGYNAEFTWVAFLSCLIASSGGALFGYDNGELLFARQLSCGEAGVDHVCLVSLC